MASHDYRRNEMNVYLTDDELKRIEARAASELTEPETWVRRVAVSIANGTARVIAREREELNNVAAL